MTHYKTLGVEPAATPEEVKRAFRRSASAAHPDKDGGSDEAMAAVNKAWAVLGDPERRAKYDETGDDGEDKFAQQVQSVLMQLFEMALETVEHDMVGACRANLKANIGDHGAEVKDLAKKIDRLEKRRDKVAVKQGPNLMHVLIDRKVTAHRQKIASLELSIRIMTGAQELLDAYESTDKDEKPTYQQRNPYGGHELDAALAAAFGFAGTGGFRGRGL